MLELPVGMLLGGVLLVSLVLVLLGVVHQLLGSARDARRYPPLGQLVDVGGYRLHLLCTGEGRPTVVLDSGLPGTCLSWTYVQPELVRFTRVCSYDRAGLGWSDASPHPRTSKQMVEELRRLLANAGIKPPYVLVGHSFGAFTVRLFAALNSNEVVGLVLVDPLHTREWLEMAEQQRRNIYRAARLCRYGTLL
ncbi:MAG TPA: alpha/beta hydrolase, partial [Candidatus Acidoferrales bacterium]|nr:alpha/beta hydrolase [Candidatus Acidoferrales bacterium]